MGRKEGSNTGKRRELSLPLGKRSGGEAGAGKEKGLDETNRSGLETWGQWLFAQLVGGMSLGEADGWQSLIQPGVVAGSMGSALSSFLVLFPGALRTQRQVLGSGHQLQGDWLIASCIASSSRRLFARPSAQGRAYLRHTWQSHVSALLPGGQVWGQSPWDQVSVLGAGTYTLGGQTES